MNNNDERDFSEEEYNAAEYRREYESELSEETAQIWESRKALFREEADKRVIRYFIGRTGWAWFVHFIVDMPEEYDSSNDRIKALYEAKDGRTTMHMTGLFMTVEKAWDVINRDIHDNTQFGDNALTHVVELDEF